MQSVVFWHQPSGIQMYIYVLSAIRLSYAGYCYIKGAWLNFNPPIPPPLNYMYHSKSKKIVGGAVASWLVHSTPDRTVQVRALARDIELCSWARHLTPTVPLSTQVYKWVSPI